MPRYFFDIHDGDLARDDEGFEAEDLAAVRQQVLRLLPDIARDEIPKDGDQHTISVVVTDEDDKPVYAATLNFTGLWLLR